VVPLGAPPGSDAPPADKSGAVVGGVLGALLPAAGGAALFVARRRRGAPPLPATRTASTGSAGGGKAGSGGAAAAAGAGDVQVRNPMSLGAAAPVVGMSVRSPSFRLGNGPLRAAYAPQQASSSAGV
jgi:hypothetical protein